MSFNKWLVWPDHPSGTDLSENIRRAVYFSGFKIFGPMPSGPNALFTLNNDNC